MTTNLRLPRWRLAAALALLLPIALLTLPAAVSTYAWYESQGSDYGSYLSFNPYGPLRDSPYRDRRSPYGHSGTYTYPYADRGHTGAYYEYYDNSYRAYDLYQPYGTGYRCAPSGNTIIIEDGIGYTPLSISVRPGDIVTWANCGPAGQHTVTSTGGLWDTGALNPGESQSVVFTRAGTYPYTCTIHGHNGTITVTR